MARNITRADLSDAVRKDMGFSYADSERLVDSIFEEITNSLEEGESVKISSFASFYLKNKRERLGRNPKTGKEYAITARTILSFCPSQILKKKVMQGNKK